MIETWVWLALVVLIPVGVIVASLTVGDMERLRQIAVGAALSLLGMTSAIWVVPGLETMHIPWGIEAGALLGPAVFRLDLLSSLLVPLPAALWLLTVVVTPRARFDRIGQGRAAFSTLVTLLAFLTASPLLLLVLWSLSTLVFLHAHGAPEHRHARRVAAVYLGLATLLFAAGIGCRTLGASESVADAGLWLIAIAACIRKGIFPFHAWIPEGFDTGRLGPSVLFSAPQMGAYVAAVLVVPAASPSLLRVIATLSLLTAVYAAALALGQRDARRAAGYLFVSQSALVMSGLECISLESLAGSLVMWISSALAFAGLARCILVLEARRGRLDLSKFHGGYEQMPLLAVSFLVMGLACMGFPGTLGFIGEEMLLAGAVDVFPVLGLCVIGAGAFTGLAVLRMYFSLFCGRPDGSIHLGARPRETIAFAAVAALLLGLGLAPAAIVSTGLDVSQHILGDRPAGTPSE